ncbi:hypothetical protein CC79DRAFT_1361432 [Sarocladium strictum]
MVERQCHGTCEWFLDTTEYRRWIESEDDRDKNHRMLWILGKAGSGKSTLLKFVSEQARTSAAETDLLFTHFFNARGGILERSVEGMYRTILSQILEKLEHLSNALLKEIRGWMPSQGGSWPIPTLVTLLKAAIRFLKGRRLVFFIDALDECNNEEAQEMVEGFETLIEEAASTGEKFRVCLASRPYPHIATNHAQYFRLDKSKYHQGDIQEYIKTHLRIGQSSDQHAMTLREDIKQQLLSRSQHVFLWAKLVVTLLNKEYRAGRPERYDKWLQGSLGDLDKLYMEIWSQDNDDYDEEDERAQVICFQWMLHHFNRGWVPTLCPRELWWGIQLGLGKDVEDVSRRSAELDDATIQRFIISTSKGLVEAYEITDGGGIGAERSVSGHGGLEYKDTPRRLQISFIHESARTFILSENGPLVKLGGFGESANLDLQGHLQLKACCEALLEYCRLYSKNALGISAVEVWKFRDYLVQVEKSVRLVRYARLSIFHHANMIQQLQLGDHDQGEWTVELYNRYKFLSIIFITDYPIDAEVPLFRILTTYGLGALMQAGWRSLFKEAHDARNCYCVPGISNHGGTHWAMKKVLEDTAVDAIRVVVEIYLKLEKRHDLVHGILVSLARQGFANRWSRRRIQRTDISPWLYVAGYSDDLATLLLIALIPAALSFTDNEAEALQRAANRGYISTLNYFIRHDIPTRFCQLSEWDFQELKAWAVKEQEQEFTATLEAICRGEISYRGFQPEEPS